MIVQTCLIVFAIFCLVVVTIRSRLDPNKLRDREYFELTLFLGSGGHTGEICQLLKGFHFKKITRINLLIATSDHSSLNFFKNSLQQQLGSDQYALVLERMMVIGVQRTNEVKQSLLSTPTSTFKSMIGSLRIAVMSLLNTTHLVSTGPGTCVPLFYIFYFLRCLKCTRARLIFVESWCRVRDLSLSGKCIRAVADDLIVHWPELAQKYKGCSYQGKVI